MRDEAAKCEKMLDVLSAESDALSAEINAKKGQGVTRLARKRQKIQDKISRCRTLLNIANKEKGKKGGRTTRRRRSSSRKNVPK